MIRFRRRLQEMQVDEQGICRMCYAASGRAEPGDETLDGQFGSERSETLKRGFFDTAIERALGAVMAIDRTEWLQNETLNFDSFNLKTPESFDDF